MVITYSHGDHEGAVKPARTLVYMQLMQQLPPMGYIPTKECITPSSPVGPSTLMFGMLLA